MEIVEPVHIEETSYAGYCVMATAQFRNGRGCKYGRIVLAEMGFLGTCIFGFVEGCVRGAGYTLSRPISHCLSENSVEYIDLSWGEGAKTSYISSWISVALLVQNTFYPALDVRTLTLSACPSCTNRVADYEGLND